MRFAFATYLPSVIPLGMPVSQPFGVFHGRTEAFSESSEVAQEVNTKAAAASRRSERKRKLNGEFFTIQDGRV